MGKCPKCGNVLMEDAVFCAECGVRVKGRMLRCWKCNSEMPAGADFCPMCGERKFSGTANSVTIPVISDFQETKNQSNFSMRWYYTLIYGLLIAMIIGSFISVPLYLTGVYTQYYIGGVYAVGSERIYEMFESLRILDILSGIDMILYAVFAIIVRNHLAQFRSGAPNKLISLLLWNSCHSIVYSIWILSEISEYTVNNTDTYSQMWVSLFTTVITSIIWICCTKSYFNKRKCLFIN